MRKQTVAVLATTSLVLAGCSSGAATHGASVKVAPAGTPTSTATSIPPNGSVSWIAGSGFEGGPVPFDGPLTSLGHRTAGRVTLRLFTSGTTSQVTCDPYHSRCVPAWCQPTSEFAVELSTDTIALQDVGTVIGVGPGHHFSLLGYSTEGTAEGGPVGVALLSVAGNVDHVTLKSAAGADTASPEKGLVALAVPGTANTGSITAFDGSGAVLQTLALPAIPTASTDECALQAQELPVAGRPPADPAAAETQIRAAFHTAFTANPGAPRYSSLVAVQNGDKLHNAIDQVLRNFPHAGNDITVTVGKLVFVNPTTAVVDWTPTYTGGAPYGPQVGTAVLVNGKWLVSEDTYCGLLRFGAATCP